MYYPPFLAAQQMGIVARELRTWCVPHYRYIIPHKNTAYDLDWWFQRKNILLQQLQVSDTWQKNRNGRASESWQYLWGEGNALQEECYPVTLGPGWFVLLEVSDFGKKMDAWE